MYGPKLTVGELKKKLETLDDKLIVIIKKENAIGVTFYTVDDIELVTSEISLEPYGSVILGNIHD